MDERDAYVSGPLQQEIVRSLEQERTQSGSMETSRDVHAEDDAFLRCPDRHRVDRRRDGDRVAVGSAAGLVGADLNVPAANSAALNGPIDAQTFRNIAKAQSPTVVNIQTMARARGRELTEFFGGQDDLLQRFFGGQGQGQGQRRRRPAPDREAPPQEGTGTGFIIDKCRLHPHEQSRGRRRRRHPRQPVRRRPDRELRGEGHRPRRADRHRADPADRDAGGAAAGGEVRRLGADAAGRLGRGDRQSRSV